MSRTKKLDAKAAEITRGSLVWYYDSSLPGPVDKCHACGHETPREGPGRALALVLEAHSPRVLTLQLGVPLHALGLKRDELLAAANKLVRGDTMPRVQRCDGPAESGTWKFASTP